MLSIKKIIYKIAHTLLSLYWKIFKPETFGVKVMILNNKKTKILLIKNSYGLVDYWQMVGGGYKPKKENSTNAVLREVREELGIEISEIYFLNMYENLSEGKKDKVNIYMTKISEDMEFKKSPEINEVKWFDLQNIEKQQITKITKFALSNLKNI